MKTICTSIAIALAAVLQASVPTEWQVRVGPKATVFQAERYHGDGLALRATLTAGGQPLPYQGTARLYAQTNGMGSAWWSLADATVSSNVLTATWLPEYDTGADVVDVFLGAPGNYQAHARIRFLPSPGATPGALPLPTPVLDFATTTVLNAPYLDAAAVTNAAEAAVGRFGDELQYGMDVGTGAIYGFVGDDYSAAYGLAWDGSWRYIKAGEGWATGGTELARMGDIPDLSRYATIEAATNVAAAVVARDAVAKSYGDGGGTFGWTGPHVIGGTGFDLFLPGEITVGNNRISTAGGHALTLPERTGTVALSSDVSQVVALVGQTSSTLSNAITNDSISAYADSATNSLGGIVYRLGAVSVSAQVDEAMSDLLGSDWRATYGGGAAGIVAALLAAVAALWRTKLDSSNGVAENLKADGLKKAVVVDTGRMSVTYGQWSNVEVSPVSGSSTDWQPQDQSFTLRVLSANTCAILATGSETPTLLAHEETTLPWTLTDVGSDTPVGSVADVTETQWADVATAASVQGKADSTALAPAWDPTKAYLLGEHVSYMGGMYECVLSMSAASQTSPDSDTTHWKLTDLAAPDATLDIMSDGRLRVVAANGTPLWTQGYALASASAVALSCEKINKYVFAATSATAFSDSATYAVGDRVAYGGKVYKCSTAVGTAGAWTGAANWDEDPDTQAFALPGVPPGVAGDFVLDVDNTANGVQVMVAISGTLGTDYDLIVEKGRSVVDVLAIEGGDLVELYFTMTAFGTAAKPAWRVVRMDVERQGVGS